MQNNRAELAKVLETRVGSSLGLYHGPNRAARIQFSCYFVGGITTLLCSATSLRSYSATGPWLVKFKVDVIWF